MLQLVGSQSNEKSHPSLVEKTSQLPEIVLWLDKHGPKVVIFLIVVSKDHDMEHTSVQIFTTTVGLVIDWVD